MAVSYPGFADRIVATAGTAKTWPHGVVRLEGQIAALTADLRTAGSAVKTTINAERAEPTWFDKLTMSARPEPVEGRFLRLTS